MGIFSIFGRKKAAKPTTTKKAAPKAAAKTTAAKKAPAKKAAPAKKLQPQCAALNAAGKQCANSARQGSKYCGSHKGYQPPARGKARGTNTKPVTGGAKDTAASGRRPAGKKQCAAKTQAGKQCQRDAVVRGKYCGVHKTTA